METFFEFPSYVFTSSSCTDILGVALPVFDLLVWTVPRRMDDLAVGSRSGVLSFDYMVAVFCGVAVFWGLSMTISMLSSLDAASSS